jgi:hypothetical protein
MLKFFERDPLVLLDGYPVQDISTLFDFDPLKVRTIDVVTHRYFKGSGVFDGIVNMTTYSHDLNGYPINRHATIIKGLAPQKQRIFHSRNYETADERASRLPDFRSQLFWSPSLDTDSSGNHHISFYTSDLEGNFIVVVQGITANGQSGSILHTFEVKK